MGLDYSFLVVTPANRVDRLLALLASHLAPGDAARVRAALPWSPTIDQRSAWFGEPPARDRRGFGNMARLPVEHSESRCFSFLFSRDDVLTEYERSSTLPSADGGRVSVGCVWCSLCAGDVWAVFEATAATSEMSRLFQRSGAVRAFWSSVGAEAGAAAIFFDCEDLERWELLYPTARQVPRPDTELYELEDGDRVHVDAYCSEALRHADG